jgi:hypothetical protein
MALDTTAIEITEMMRILDIKNVRPCALFSV